MVDGGDIVWSALTRYILVVRIDFVSGACGARISGVKYKYPFDCFKMGEHRETRWPQPAFFSSRLYIPLFSVCWTIGIYSGRHHTPERFSPSPYSQAAMTLVGALLKAVVVCSAFARVSSINVPCPTGTRVYSLSTWSGHWLDGVVVRCTGDSDDQTIPPDYNQEGGGAEDGNICAGTEGVQSIEWSSSSFGEGVVVYVRITCLDGTSTLVADG